MSWNGYPHYIRTKTIKLFQTREKRQQKSDDQDNLSAIFCRIPYTGAQGDRLVKNLTKNFRGIISQPFILKNIDKVTNMSYYCNKKDRIADYLKTHVLYEFSWPARNAGRIGKTDQNLGTQIKGCCWLDKNSPVFNHLAEYNFYLYTLILHTLSFPCDGDVTLTNQDILGHVRATVTDNMKIIGKSKKLG